MNNNTDIFEKNSKENYIKNLNASNEAKRLENKIKVYRNNLNNNSYIKNNNLNNNSYINNNNSKNNNSYIKNNNDSKNKNSMLKLSTPKHKPSGTNNSTLTNKIAKTGLQAAGVPKPFADIAVNSEIGQKTISRLKKKNFALNMFDRLTQGSDIKKKEELESNGGNTSFSFSRKEKRSIGIASLVFIGVIFVFCGLFITSSTVYLNAVGFGGADSLKGKDVEDKINKKSDNVDEDIANQDDVAFDIFIDNSDSLKFSKSKLDSSNLIKTKKVTEDIQDDNNLYYIEKDYGTDILDNLEDFYPSIKDDSKNYNERMVYDFYYKMYKIYITYRDYYGVYLDLPLLMSTLTIQSSDMNVVFESNLSPEDKGNDIDPNEYSFCKNWSSYSTNRDDSSHDMEVLAQHMVSQQVEEYCKDSSGNKTKSNILKDNEIGTQTLTCDEGQTYGTSDVTLEFDREKYTEFLREFLEKKYYIDENLTLSSVDIHYDCSKKVNNNTSSENNDNSISNSTSDIVNPFAKAMIELANKEYAENQGYNDGIKYTNAMGYAPGTPWCAMFVWWLGLNTSVDGKTLVDDIVPFGSAGTGTYIRLFNNSTKENINFYYNDNCSRLAGKNNSNNKYVPKPGDYIFFDWEANYYDISSDTQDHTALVEKYENGTIYTIEGNSSDTIRKKSYDINDCRVIGFGSWY